MSLQLLTHCVQQAPEAVTHVPTATAGVCVGGGTPRCRHYLVWEEDDDDDAERSGLGITVLYQTHGSSWRAVVTEATQVQRTPQVTSAISTKNKKAFKGNDSTLNHQGARRCVS